VNGKWIKASKYLTLPDPIDGKTLLHVSDTSIEETIPFIKSLNSCPKSGLHNPFKSPERYVQYGNISAIAATTLRDPNVMAYFIKLIQRVAPKSDKQAYAEINVTQKFLENFSGDQVRFLAKSFSVPGDHVGQMSSGYRWPYGPVVIIAPFNFPLEIPMLQLLGALYMGNKVLLKSDSRVSLVMEQTLRMLHNSGLPLADVDFINCDGSTMHQLLLRAQPRLTQFTGSSKVAEILSRDLHGKVKIEDAGWDWKLLGPDVSDVDYVAWMCDHDAYSYSGQKCSAQSALFIHENWMKINFLKKLKELASRRKLEDLTIGPVLTVTNERFLQHIHALLQIPGAELIFGGNLLTNHHIPSCYGSFEPTAIKVPIEEMLKPEYYELCTTEIFGPFQIVVSYTDAQLPLILQAFEQTHAHLTAAVVSNDVIFRNKVNIVPSCLIN
jgi:1-pyrroline-5-carboxylate dehydrogenase